MQFSFVYFDDCRHAFSFCMERQVLVFGSLTIYEAFLVGFKQQHSTGGLITRRIANFSLIKILFCSL